jgi:hypothetical protein
VPIGKRFYFLVPLLLIIGSCAKQIDYSADIDGIKQDISAIKLRLDSLSNAVKAVSSDLTNLEFSLKLKIDNANNRIDSISSALKTISSSDAQRFADITQSLKTLTDNIAVISASFAKSNSDTKKQFDSLNLKIDSSYQAIKKNITNVNDSLNDKIAAINVNYNTILAYYLNILKIISASSKITIINGSIFTGSFLRGSLLNFYELDSLLTQTGRSFNSTIDDDYGNFVLSAQNIKGKLMRVVGDGFYWNEVLNENSESRVTLTAICKIDSVEKINVNMLTHLERPRVEYLYTNGGLSFDSAKKTAITEVLAAFGFKNTGIKRAEALNIFGVNDESKILLAISTLIQGYRTESEVTQLLGDIAEDLKKDGKLDDVNIGNDIESHLYYMDTTTVLNNVKVKYRKIYNADTVNTLNMSFVKKFQDSTNYNRDKDLLEFPLLGTQSGKNVLNSTNNTYGIIIALTCINKRKGLNFKVVLTDENGDPLPSISGNCAFGLNLGSTIGWSIIRNCGTITAQLGSVVTNDQYVIAVTDNIAKIKITFYERGLTTPTRSKLLTFGP